MSVCHTVCDRVQGQHSTPTVGYVEVVRLKVFLSSVINIFK